ncbi:MAG TPA: hypothetical protein VE360_11965, partial [Pyrinomonadaceae bacterium]|nr:hypothetical protein [Pyrinomonadaceae bacterium]
MKRPDLRKQLSLPVLFVAVSGLAFYVLVYFAPEAPPAAAPDERRLAFTAYEWARTLVSVALWISAAFVVVRALNELIFLIFRKRKGYEAPSLMRDIFS